MTLAEGRSLLAKVQTELISKQVQRWLAGQTHCENCGAALRHKDSRSTVLRTVYGKVTVKSPRLRVTRRERSLPVFIGGDLAASVGAVYAVAAVEVGG